MATLDEIQKMQGEGKSEQEIISTLQSRGYSMNDLTEAMSQAKIKQAVNTDDQEQTIKSIGQGPDMQPSMMTGGNPPVAGQTDSPQYAQNEDYMPQGYPQQEAYSEQPGSQYSSYQPEISADTISEIADQLLTEKLMPLKTKFESILDLKTELESKLDVMNERLMRVEKIIDRLQLSVLQKVGDYITNVEDIKREIIETQQSFKSMLEAKKQSKSPYSEKEI